MRQTSQIEVMQNQQKMNIKRKKKKNNGSNKKIEFLLNFSKNTIFK
jgi:hypothetical protein